MNRFLLALAALPCLLLLGCPDDDDDSVTDDDDVTVDDDDATDDDDDDATAGVCPDAIAAMLAEAPTWTNTPSCAFAAAFAIAPGDVAHVSVWWDLPKEGLVVGQSYAVALDFDPKNGVSGSIGFETGTNVADADCDDALEGEMVIDTSWTGTTGSATLTIVEVLPDGGFRSNVVVEGVTLENDDDGSGEACTLPTLTWPGMYMGWLPG